MLKDIKNSVVSVYHGTSNINCDILEKGIELNKNKYFCDFGPGFYTTTQFGTAVSYAIIRHKRLVKMKDLNRYLGFPLVLSII